MEKDGVAEDHERQIESVFNRLWVGRGDNYEDAELEKDTLGRYDNWSDGRLSAHVRELFSSDSRSDVKIIDAGCGLGFSFNSIFSSYKERIEYTGMDLIDLSRTKNFLKSRGYNCRFIRDSMVAPPPEIPREHYDVVLALGTLMCTDSVLSALTSTYSLLRPGGLYIGWIINAQKPVRAETDKYLRQYFGKYEEGSEFRDELLALAKFSFNLGEALGEQKVAVPEDVPSLGLNSGEYTIQTLIYDYLIKLYYVKGHTLERTYDQLFDWFMPKWYHQTKREELEEMIDTLQPKSREIVSKTNGHFFFLRK